MSDHGNTCDINQGAQTYPEIGEGVIDLCRFPSRFPCLLPLSSPPPSSVPLPFRHSFPIRVTSTLCSHQFGLRRFTAADDISAIPGKKEGRKEGRRGAETNTNAPGAPAASASVIVIRAVKKVLLWTLLLLSMVEFQPPKRILC